MTGAALASIVVASLMGSLHCAGMCGGLVAVYAGARADGSKALPHLAYHGARLLAYTSLGALAGLLGGAIDLASTAAGFGRVATIVAGTLMGLWGLGVLLKVWAGEARPAQGLLTLSRGRKQPGIVARLSARLLTGLAERPASVRGLLLGLFSGLLPCGWLYAFVLGAAATASAAYGALVMMAFWSGTVPVLLGLGLGLQRLLDPLRRHLPALTALGLIVAGVVTVTMRANLPEEAFRQIHAAEIGQEGKPSTMPQGGGCPLHGGSSTEAHP